MKSILESDLFKCREDERERMMKMFTNEQLPQSSSSHAHVDSFNDRAAANSGDNGISDTNSSINDRMDQTYLDKPVKLAASKKGKKRANGTKSSELLEEDF